MKNYYYLFIFMLLTVTGCQSQGPTRISGIVQPGTYQDYKFILFDGKNITDIPFDSTSNRFSIDVCSDSLHFIHLHVEIGKDKEKWIYSNLLYITPGRKIDLDIRLADHQAQTIVLSDDEDNRALTEYQERYGIQQRIAWTLPPTPDKIGYFLDQVYTLPDTILSKYQVTSDIHDYLKIGGYIHSLDLMDGISYMYARDTNGYQLPANVKQKLPSPQQILDNPITALFDNAPYHIYLWLSEIARTPEEKIEKLKKHFTDPALIQSTTDYIIARYVMSYTYSDRFEEDLARVKKMTEILPDKGEKYLREMNNKKHITPGAFLPEAILENVRGEKCQLSDLKENYLYIDFWASWCGPCCAEVPYLQKLEATIKNPKIKFVSISLDTDKKAWHRKMEQLKMHGEQYIVADEKLAETLNINNIPHFLLYDPEGKLMQYEAPRPSTGKPLQEMLENLK